MSKVVAPKNGKICMLCTNWNGAIGSKTIEAKPGGVLMYDRAEKETCFKTGAKMPAWASCSGFKPRY